jgi:hypothetical protein
MFIDGSGFKNERRENPTKVFKHENKRKTPKRKTKIKMEYMCTFGKVLPNERKNRGRNRGEGETLGKQR